MNNQTYKKNSQPKIWRNQDRLYWAIRFANVNLLKPSKKTLETLRDEFMIFMRTGNTSRPATMAMLGKQVSDEDISWASGLVISCTSRLQPETFKVADFGRLQKKFKEVIDEIVFRQEQMEQWDKHSKLQRAQLGFLGYNAPNAKRAYEIAQEKYPVDPVLSSRPFPQFNIKAKFSPGVAMLGVGSNLIYTNGATHDMAILNLLFLVVTEKTENIVRCPNPECKRIFVRVGKRLYCSDECSKIMTQKNWRNKGKRGKHHGSN